MMTKVCVGLVVLSGVVLAGAIPTSNYTQYPCCPFGAHTSVETPIADEVPLSTTAETQESAPACPSCCASRKKLKVTYCEVETAVSDKAPAVEAPAPAPTPAPAPPGLVD